MKALILCGGFGSRIKTIVTAIPKPMAKIGGRPFLEYLVLQLRNQNLDDMIFSIGYLGDKIKDYFKNGKKWQVNIGYAREKRPLGTAGAVKLAGEKFRDRNIMVLNGDSLLAIDFRDLIKFHQKKKAMATVALVRIKDVSRYGQVKVDKKGRIIKFDEKGGKGAGLINGGIYILSRQVLKYMPNRKKCSLEYDILPHLAGNGCYGRIFKDAFFIDIGTPKSYLAIRKKPRILLSAIYAKKKEVVCVDKS